MKQLTLISFLLLSVNYIYGQKPKSTIGVKAPNTTVAAESQGSKKIVEEMPRFPGCEDVADDKARSTCAQTKLIQYVYSTLVYPKQAKKGKIEGTVYAQFKVMEDGTLSDINILRDIGSGCGEAVMDLLNKMNEEHTWIPGMQRGEPVAVQFTLPVKFRL
ncbi:energy transducer TonB [Saprospiraceae bacterium]|nr:energy transducer TonB [Saprospiraceae bacterium]